LTLNSGCLCKKNIYPKNKNVVDIFYKNLVKFLRTKNLRCNVKGVIINYFEDFITDYYGPEKWEEIFNLCPVKSQQIYIGPQTYPDNLLVGILQVVSRQLKTPLEVLLKNFGNFLLHKFSEDYNNFFTPYSHPKQFLLSVDSIIHIEVMKMLSEATPPKFTYDDTELNKLTMRYHSKRKLCQLVEGIIEGVSEKFKTPIKYFQSSCMSKGDENCCFELTFGTQEPQK
jgi:predicted hydrocarbon binding protein